jgi:hypothetical protein
MKRVRDRAIKFYVKSFNKTSCKFFKNLIKNNRHVMAKAGAKRKAIKYICQLLYQAGMPRKE